MPEINGILVLHKPRGMTSHDCVAKVRRLANTKKVGHTGTLDPEVTGVLPICLGQATKVAEYLLEHDKEYIAEITLGRSTTTEDASGEIIEDVPLVSAPSREELEEVLVSFQGSIKQVPPMYSAVKKEGRKLYELARKGIVVEREPREVQINQLELQAYDPLLPYPVFSVRVACSKGTYIRSLAVDIGRKLGYPAHMSALVRTASGPYRLEQSYSFEQIETWSVEDWSTYLEPIDSALSNLPKISLPSELSKRVRFGQSLVLKPELEGKIKTDQLYRIYDEYDNLLAIYTGVYPRLIKPKKVFVT